MMKWGGSSLVEWLEILRRPPHDLLFYDRLGIAARSRSLGAACRMEFPRNAATRQFICSLLLALSREGAVPF